MYTSNFSKCPGGNCPRWKLPGGNVLRWEFSKLGDVWVGVDLMGIVLGGRSLMWKLFDVKIVRDGRVVRLVHFPSG